MSDLQTISELLLRGRAIRERCIHGRSAKQKCAKCRVENNQTISNQEIIDRIKKALEFGRDSFPCDSAGLVLYLNALIDLGILKRRIKNA